jgi:hypothetical protein
MPSTDDDADKRMDRCRPSVYPFKNLLAESASYTLGAFAACRAVIHDFSHRQLAAH